MHTTILLFRTVPTNLKMSTITQYSRHYRGISTQFVIFWPKITCFWRANVGNCTICYVSSGSFESTMLGASFLKFLKLYLFVKYMYTYCFDWKKWIIWKIFIKIKKYYVLRISLSVLESQQWKEQERKALFYYIHFSNCVEIPR